MTAAQPGLDTPMVDTAEMVHISSLALLKVMLLFFFLLLYFCIKVINQTKIFSSRHVLDVKAW